MKTTGAKLLTSVLADAGVEIVAGIPGHTIFSFANAVPEQPALRPLLVRHEAVAAFAADVYFRLSGRMMAVFAHSIPGAANAAVGIANAYADSSSMLVITGETASDALGRAAYQELSRGFDGDTGQWLRHISKKTWQPRTPYQLVEHALRALKIGPSGRPGPVVLDVYQELWDAEIEIPDLPSATGFMLHDDPRPSAASVDRAAELLKRAKRPLIVAGNGVNLARAQAELLAFAEATNIPVATTVTGKGAFPEDHRLSLGIIGWVGTSVANHAGRGADLIFSIGSRMTESTTSSWQPGVTFNLPGTTLIQSDIEIAELANVFPVDAALIGHAREVLRDMRSAVGKLPDHVEWLRDLAQRKAEWADIVARCARDPGSPIRVGRVVDSLRQATAGENVSVVCDVGKHHKWIAQQFEARYGDAVVSSMGAATMGIGPCGAVGASLARPEAKTVAWTGDGGLTMVPFVLPTVAEYRMPIVFVVIDDGAYGAVANIQQARFGRTVYSEFTANGTNPGYKLDISRLSEACGIPARRITEAADIDRAMAWAFEQSGPALLDVIVDRKSVAPDGGGSKLAEIWKHPIHPWAARHVTAGSTRPALVAASEGKKGKP
ncbi:MAG TPA: thiamine pyrophosphate-binding protein [Candidatus Limnocylindria bacterium]